MLYTQLPPLRKKKPAAPSAPDYFKSTCHPWASLLFLIPLLAVYELSIIWLTGTASVPSRNGADDWLRTRLVALGFHPPWCPPVILVGIFMLWSWFRRADKPAPVGGILVGMLVESGIFAMALWGMGRSLRRFVDLGYLDLTKLASPEKVPPVVGQFIGYLGAGIYEEVVFRLLAFGLLFALLGLLMPRTLALILAAVASAILFAWAHHSGPNGERHDDYVFLFRSAAGLFFVVLYQCRGFGIAVGTHAFYDVLVGMGVR